MRCGCASAIVVRMTSIWQLVAATATPHQLSLRTLPLLFVYRASPHLLPISVIAQEKDRLSVSIPETRQKWKPFSVWFLRLCKKSCYLTGMFQKLAGKACCFVTPPIPSCSFSGDPPWRIPRGALRESPCPARRVKRNPNHRWSRLTRDMIPCNWVLPWTRKRFVSACACGQDGAFTPLLTQPTRPRRDDRVGMEPSLPATTRPRGPLPRRSGNRPRRRLGAHGRREFPQIQ